MTEAMHLIFNGSYSHRQLLTVRSWAIAATSVRLVPDRRARTIGAVLLGNVEIDEISHVIEVPIYRSVLDVKRGSATSVWHALLFTWAYRPAKV
jgi:hypothetical protein